MLTIVDHKKNIIFAAMKGMFKTGILFALLASWLSGAAQSIMGKDFWVAFPASPKSLYHEEHCHILASSTKHCSGTVTNPNTGWSTPFEVAPNQTCVIPIPCEEVQQTPSQVNNSGLHVIASDTLSLFAFQITHPEEIHHTTQVPITRILEATLVLPTNRLGDEYIVETSPAIYYDRSVFCVLAVQNNTVVDITTTCSAANGGPSPGTPFIVRLNAGQTYFLKSTQASSPANPKDFSGTQVKTRGGKPIAVFAGNKYHCDLSVPNAEVMGELLMEQMTPVNRWGKRFIISGTLPKEGDTIRVTALHDKCKVFRDGQQTTTLMAGETYSYGIPDGTPAELLETSQPAYVQLCLVNHVHLFPHEKVKKKGTVAIDPLEQGVRQAVFTSVYESLYGTVSSCYRLDNYVNIATETANVASMRLDGRNIASSFHTLPHDNRYSYAKIQLETGTHTLSNGSGSFVAQAYGGLLPLFNMYDFSNCYAYSAGSMMHDFSAQIMADGKYSTDYPQGMFFCEDDTPVFHLHTDFPVSRAEWDFGDGDTATGDTVPHHFPGPGDYLVSCDVYTHGNGADSLAASLHASVHIQRPVENDVWWTACDGCYWNGMHCTASGDYTANLQTVGGCDSIVHLHLSLHRSDTAFYDVTACDSYLWRDSLYTRTGRYLHDEGSTALGCDSVAVLRLKIRHDPPFAVQGIEQVAYATDIWPGVYRYLAVDSTLLEGGAVTWECSNPDWVVTPLSDFSCQVFVRTPGQATLTATTNGCHSTTSILLNATPFGVGEDHGDGVEVRPNPAKDEVVVTGKGIQRVEIHNLLGQRVASVEGHSAESLAISLEGLPQGVYLVSVLLADGKRCEKKLVVR